MLTSPQRRLLSENLESEHTLKLDMTDPEGVAREMLAYIGKIAGHGHSFSVVVDPGDHDYEKKFNIDGDGQFRMSIYGGRECNECDKWIDFDRIAEGQLYCGKQVVGICDGPDEFWCKACGLEK